MKMIKRKLFSDFGDQDCNDPLVINCLSLQNYPLLPVVNLFSMQLPFIVDCNSIGLCSQFQANLVSTKELGYPCEN